MKKQQFKTPILFCVFNRPSTTKKTFKIIKKIKPSTLYIAADGPRSGISGELDLCLAARKITENIDWECKVFRLYREENLGCGKAISGAVGWFFSNVDSGIILEDDCLPDLFFFKFTADMLNKYENDSSIMHISGDNFIGKNNSKQLPLFSKYPHVWGWATWKRAWRKYDFDMLGWRKLSIFEKINSIHGNLLNKLYWTSKFDSVGYKITDTWDYQWIYTNFKNSASSVFPYTNLVSNIGFGIDSTHTKKDEHRIDLSSDILLNDINYLEEKYVFKVNSWKTVLNFIYFSIFGMFYDIIRIYNK